MLPDLHERVVQHVFGAFTVAHDAQRHAEQPARLALVQRPQREALAARAGEQGSFVVEPGRGGGHLAGGEVDQRTADSNSPAARSQAAFQKM